MTQRVTQQPTQTPTPQALTSAAFWEDYYATSRKCYPSRLSKCDREMMGLLHLRLKRRAGGKLLEMGCGGSYWLPYFARRYRFAVSGIDFSERRLRDTRRNLKRAGADGELVRADVRKASAIQGEFDVVCSFGVVEHFNPPSDVLAMFAEYLKPDGVLITTAPHLKGFWGALDRVVSRKTSIGYTRLDIHDLARFHGDAGLTVSYARYFRWGDIGIVNWSGTRLLIRIPVYGLSVALNVLLSLLPVTLTLPTSGYADMLVVASKQGRRGELS